EHVAVELLERRPVLAGDFDVDDPVAHGGFLLGSIEPASLAGLQVQRTGSRESTRGPENHGDERNYAAAIPHATTRSTAIRMIGRGARSCWRYCGYLSRRSAPAALCSGRSRGSGSSSSATA